MFYVVTRIFKRWLAANIIVLYTKNENSVLEIRYISSKVFISLNEIAAL